MAFYIIAGAFLAGVNIAGLVMLYIQKKEKNLSPCERSFSDTNDRTDTEKAAMLYALEQYQKLHSENADNSNPNNSNSEQANSNNEAVGEIETTIQENKDIKSSDISKEEECKNPLKPDSKNKIKDKSKKPVSDITIFIVAALGGALSIYASMFFMKYKLKNIIYMLLIPAVIGLNIFCILEIFQWHIALNAVQNITS